MSLEETAILIDKILSKFDSPLVVSLTDFRANKKFIQAVINLGIPVDVALLKDAMESRSYIPKANRKLLEALISKHNIAKAVSKVRKKDAQTKPAKQGRII